MARECIWLKKPEAKDYLAAHDYLSLLSDEHLVKKIVHNLRTAPNLTSAAKDLLRASRLPLLPSESSHVAADLRKIKKGKPLSPVLLVRGDARIGAPLIIADGYHRICASWYVDEDSQISCRLVGIT